MIDFKKHSKSLLLTWFAVLVFFVCFIGFPLFCVLTSVSAEDLKKVFVSSIFQNVMKNTFLECICSSGLSVFTGYLFAFAVVKGKIPFRKFFAFIPLIHLMTPPFVGGLAFILLFGRQGFITYKLLGLNISLYGFWGLLIAQTLCFFPMAYLICLQVLLGINPNLEKAAKSMGVGNWKIFWTITFPLSLNGIISSFLFVAVNVLSDFGNPLIIAGRFRVLAVEIYAQLTGWLNVGISAALGIVLVVPSIILFFLQNKIIQKSFRKNSAIGGKDGMFSTALFARCGDEKRSDFSKLNSSVNILTTIILTLFVSLISILIVAQFLSIFFGSFQKLWGINTAWTMEHIFYIRRYGLGLQNSLIFSLIAAFIGTLIALLSSFMVHRTNVPLRRIIDIFAQLPSAIPGTLLGLALSIAASKLHFRFSEVLIICSMVISFMPFSYRVISQSFASIKTSLDDAARNLGSNPLSTLFRILLPTAQNGIFSGFLYDFIRGAGTLSSVIFLVSFSTPLASINIINLAEQGSWGKSAALAMVLTLFTFAILGVCYGIIKASKYLFWIWSKRSFKQFESECL